MQLFSSTWWLWFATLTVGMTTLGYLCRTPGFETAVRRHYTYMHLFTRHVKRKLSAKLWPCAQSLPPPPKVDASAAKKEPDSDSDDEEGPP